MALSKTRDTMERWITAGTLMIPRFMKVAPITRASGNRTVVVRFIKSGRRPDGSGLSDEATRVDGMIGAPAHANDHLFRRTYATRVPVGVVQVAPRLPRRATRIPFGAWAARVARQQPTSERPRLVEERRPSSQPV
jgi:hypothetical protein